MIDKIALGTVQFGLKYGISNSIGQTDRDEAAKILTYAASKNIQFIDTANVYGDSERVLGSLNVMNFNIVTKTPHFAEKNIGEFSLELFRKSMKESL